MFDLSDDDANSTKLTGKKLKNRGVVMEGQHLAIYEDGPEVGIDAEKEQEGQEFFQDREYGKENEQAKDERLKKEMLAAKKVQQDQAKLQQQNQQQQAQKNPTEAANKVQDGIELSQNEGRPVTRDVDQKAQMKEAIGELHQGHKLTPEQAANLQNAVPANRVQDQRENKGLEL